MIETAQKGMAWMRLTATGTAGHGSMINDDNAVTQLCEAVARLGRHEFPVHLTKTVRAFLDEVSDAFGIELDPGDMQATVARLGPLARIIGATLRNTANPTMLDAGYKHNVVPGRASAMVDGRFLPGFEAEWERELDEVLGPDIVREYVHYDIALETEFEGALVEAMAGALKAEDPGARAVPYMLSGGTDAKSFSRLGIRGFGFSPLRLPPTSTSPACSTASTSGCRPTRCSSAPACSTGSWTRASSPPLRSASAAAARPAAACGPSPCAGRRTRACGWRAPSRRTRRGSAGAPWSARGRRRAGSSPRGTRTSPRTHGATRMRR
jgi:hypothetical protein